MCNLDEGLRSLLAIPTASFYHETPRAARIAPLLLIGSVLPSCGPDAQSPQQQTPVETRAAYSETRDFATVEQSLGDLQAHGFELVQAFRPEDIGSPALGSLIRACGARSIPFRAWITLPHEQGYWIGESNVGLTGRAVGGAGG